MEEVRELEAFAAVVYSSHFELGVAGEQPGAPLAPVILLDRDPLETPSGQGPAAEEAVLGDEASGRGDETRVLEQVTGMFENVWGRVTRG